jgi:dUTP pyrophosphatase
MKFLKVYKTNDNATLPEFATEGSACFDLKACLVPNTKVTTFNPWNKEVDVPVKLSNGKLSIQVYPGYRVMVPTGLIFDIDPDHVIKVYSRSSMALKKGLMLVNGVGVVDSDFINESQVLLYNTSDAAITIHHGDRIAQAMVEKTEHYKFEEISEAPAQKTNRDGGFGSTGE